MLFATYYGKFPICDNTKKGLIEIVLKHMTGAWTNPKTLTLKKTWNAWLIVWKYNPIFLFSGWTQLGPFWHFFNLLKLFLDLGSGSKTVFWTCLCKQSTLVLDVYPYVLFLIRPHCGPLLHSFGHFETIFWPFGSIFSLLVLFLGWNQVQHTNFWSLIM